MTENTTPRKTFRVVSGPNKASTRAANRWQAVVRDAGGSQLATRIFAYGSTREAAEAECLRVAALRGIEVSR